MCSESNHASRPPERPWYRLHPKTVFGIISLTLVIALANAPLGNPVSSGDVEEGFPAVYYHRFTQHFKPVFYLETGLPVIHPPPEVYEAYFPKAFVMNAGFLIGVVALWCLLAETVARRRFSIRQLLAMTCCVAIVMGSYTAANSHNRASFQQAQRYTARWHPDAEFLSRETPQGRRDDR